MKGFENQKKQKFHINGMQSFFFFFFNEQLFSYWL